MTAFDILKKVDGFTWRLPEIDDAADLAALGAVCAEIDGNKTITDADS